MKAFPFVGAALSPQRNDASLSLSLGVVNPPRTADAMVGTPAWEGMVLFRGRGKRDKVHWARRYAVVESRNFMLYRDPSRSTCIKMLPLSSCLLSCNAAGPGDASGPGGADALTLLAFGHAPLTLSACSGHVDLKTILGSEIERLRAVHSERWSDRPNSAPSPKTLRRRERSERSLLQALDSLAAELDADTAHAADVHRHDDDDDDDDDDGVFDASGDPHLLEVAIDDPNREFLALAAALSDSSDPATPTTPASPPPEPPKPAAAATPITPPKPPSRPLRPTPPQGRNALRSAIHAAHGRRFRLLPAKGPSAKRAKSPEAAAAADPPATTTTGEDDDEEDEEDDNLVSIEDAYMAGYIDAREYQARLAMVETDAMAAYFRVPATADAS